MKGGAAMGALRRLYIYVVSTVSLVAVAGGVGSLLETVLREVEDSISGSMVTAGGASREQLSLAIALIAVGGPVWLVHWWLARRGMRSEDPQGAEDRGSAIRGWYLAFVAAASLSAGMVALVALASTLFGRVLGVADEWATWSAPLAGALVAWPAWAVTTRSRAAEIRATPMTGTSAWITRLYRYGALYASLLVVLVASAGLIETLLSVLVNRPEFGLDDNWWRQTAITQACAIVVGIVVWVLHWRDAGATIRDAAAIGEDDRRTRLRAVYFGGTLVTATAWSAVVVAGSLADLVRQLTGLSAGSSMAFLEGIVGPPIAMIPVMAAGLWHARFAAREARDVDPGQVESWERIARLLVSLVGLALVAAGSAPLIQAALERLASGGETSMTGDSASMMQVPWYLAQLAVGAVLWLPAWAGILARRARDLAAERAAASTRAHLFLVVGVALVAAVPTAVLTVYRMLDTLLGGESVRPLLAELSSPISVLVVAVAIGGYHLRLLLGDLRAGLVAAPAVVIGPALATVGNTVTAPGTGPAAEPSAAPYAAAAEIEVAIRIRAGDDADRWIARLQEGLPPGATLEVRHPA